MKKLLVLFFSLTLALPAFAFETEDEQIDHYLKILNSAHDKSKQLMLKRLQWSGLTNARLFDEIESMLEKHIKPDHGSRNEKNAAYLVRALGYSGQEKYRSIILRASKQEESNRLSRHAEKAMDDLDKFAGWHQQIAANGFEIQGKPAEVSMYMKMLSIEDVFIQRLAARAIFHERHRDTDLLKLAADKLKTYYLESYLDGEAQDTAAWLCKAIGQSGESEYYTLLQEVAATTPHNKIAKYAAKFSY